MSGEYLFELSCTNDKVNIDPIRIVDPSVLDLSQHLERPAAQKLKTE